LLVPGEARGILLMKKLHRATQRNASLLTRLILNLKCTFILQADPWPCVDALNVLQKRLF
jgi:hypothetical protein